MDAAFLKAAVPEPYRILGLQLRPLSLGHYILMRRFDVSFVSDEAEAHSLGDLVVGVLICSRTYRQAIELMNDPRVDSTVARWGRRWQRDLDFLGKVDLFNRYIRDGMSMPRIMRQGNGRELPMPWVQSVKLALMRHTHMSEDEILDRPLGLSFWDWACIGEMEGTIQMEGADYAAMKRDAIRFMEELKGKGVECHGSN